MFAQDEHADAVVPDAETSQDTKPAIAVAAVVILITAALVWYARTAAFAWDEGYHLVAAWLIAHGRQPYIDFVFPQTPDNAYWNALLLRIFGENWRVPHTAAALLTSGAIAMIAAHVYRRLPLPRNWRAAAAITAAVIFGFNTAVVDFGSLQAYGFCLFSIVAAYLLTVGAVDRPGLLRPVLAGFFAGLAAASSLLTALVGPVLLVWMLAADRAGSRVRKLLVFCAGEALAFIPLLRLLIKAPHPVIFGFLQYQLLYRKVEWDDAGYHNLGEVLSWANSSQAVLLVLLAVAGILFIRKNVPNLPLLPVAVQQEGANLPLLPVAVQQEARPATSSARAELYLCGTLAFVVGAYLLTARPTFTRYFLFTVPFLAVAAVYGLYEGTERLATPPRPWLAAAVLCALTCYGLVASLFEERDDMSWHDMEQTAAKVREVTPPDAPLLADEMVYFLLRRTPPSGTELEDSHKLTFSDSAAKALHILPRPKLDLMVKAGRFDTVEMCDDDEISRLDLASLYSKSATVGSCQVFWKWGKPAEK